MAGERPARPAARASTAVNVLRNFIVTLSLSTPASCPQGHDGPSCPCSRLTPGAIVNHIRRLPQRGQARQNVIAQRACGADRNSAPICYRNRRHPTTTVAAVSPIEDRVVYVRTPALNPPASRTRRWYLRANQFMKPSRGHGLSCSVSAPWRSPVLTSWRSPSPRSSSSSQQFGPRANKQQRPARTSPARARPRRRST